ncbi:MAG: PE-PPE domain-containing protein [Mycobacterium sp.]
MAKHRQTTVNKWAPYVTTGVALNVATLFAFTYATDSHVTLNPLLSASTSIFVDGTKSVTGNEEGTPFLRMADSFGGYFDQTKLPGEGSNVFVEYPRSLGPLTGLGDPTYDESEGQATATTVQAVKDAQLRRNPGETIYVVGYSQGAGAASQAITQLEEDGQADGVDYLDGVEFVLAADPRRNDGGILARLPKGVYVPILGVSFGDGTTPESAKVIQVTKQYDGVADAPNYIFNVVADANAIMGFYYLHSGYYKDVDPTTLDPDDVVVTHSVNEDGTVGPITDVLIKAPKGKLPLTMPLLQLGVPVSIVEALDPFLRAIIETGYDRPSVAPSTPVPFKLFPPPSKWLPDVQSVAAGAVQTGQALTGTTPQTPDPLAKNQNNVTTFVDEGTEGQDVEGQNPPPADPSESEGLVVDPTKTVPPPTQDKLPTTIKKAEPPRKPFGGWKPGDLLRKIFSPQPTTGGGQTPDKSSTSPEPSGPPAAADKDKDPASAPAAA